MLNPSSARIDPIKKSGSSLDVTISEDVKNEVASRDILVLKMARNGTLFATITTSEMTIWQTKPTAVVAHVRRSQLSLNSYGPNKDLLIRPDNQIFVVQTTQGYFITYSLASDPLGRVYRPTFVHSHYSHSRQRGGSGGSFMVGAGEAGGVREYSIRFRMVIKVDAGIVKALALDDELVVSTEKPAAVQCIRWTPDSKGSQTSTQLLSKMGWIHKEKKTRTGLTTTEMVYDRPMNLSTWVTSDGRAYAVQKVNELENDGSTNMFKGYCFHIPASPEENAVKVAINARFSLVAVGQVNGIISIYNARDYAGNIPLSHAVKPPSSMTGKLAFVTWSPDGYALFAGYEKGWALWSVYGKLGAHSFWAERDLIKRNQGEGYLDGVRDGCWIGGGQDLLLIKYKGDGRLWALEMAKSAITGCYNSANVSRAVLQTNEKLLIYRGYELADLTTLVQENSILWNHVTMPPVYLIDNWPVKSVVISPDGRYVAIAGKRGLAHYSVNSGRWKTFVNEKMEQDFHVRGGMCWYHHILIAAVECDGFYEIRLYSRETDLDNSLLLHIETLPAPVVLVTLVGFDSLLAYTLDNILYHYVITPTKGTVKLVQVGQLTFHGIIRSPSRVRGLSWILPEEQIREGDPAKDVTVASVLFLVDGKLALLQPGSGEDGEVKYEMRVLEKNVEYYCLMRDQPLQFVGQPGTPISQTPAQMVSAGNGNFEGGLRDSLWVFDGKDLKAWIDVQEVMRSARGESRELPMLVKVGVDFYPMSILLSKGIILGIESELVQRRDIQFSYFKFSTRTQLFIHHFLRFLLANGNSEAALQLAAHFESLAYFPHALEVLLHDVLDEEADSIPDPSEAVLPDVVRFLTNFRQYLDIIVQCTRKTEVASWRHLFSVVGSPQVLFEESLARGNLKTAGGYLLILHTMEQLSSSSKDMVRLLAIAVAQGDWDLCKELARFLVALDDTGKTLKEALELVELRSPAEDMEKSFMFESARLMPPPISQARKAGGNIGGDGASTDGGSEGTVGEWGGSSSVSEQGASGDEIPHGHRVGSSEESDGVRNLGVGDKFNDQEDLLR
ncbi:RIC1-domain-containing protein [Kalaharituber pfeilii]|nr:RIC1-domain-containing protein [Kalaharituber pfeilii]